MEAGGACFQSLGRQSDGSFGGLGSEGACMFNLVIKRSASFKAAGELMRRAASFSSIPEINLPMSGYSREKSLKALSSEMSNLLRMTSWMRLRPSSVESSFRRSSPGKEAATNVSVGYSPRTIFANNSPTCHMFSCVPSGSGGKRRADPGVRPSKNVLQLRASSRLLTAQAHFPNSEMRTRFSRPVVGSLASATACSPDRSKWTTPLSPRLRMPCNMSTRMGKLSSNGIKGLPGDCRCDSSSAKRAARDLSPKSSVRIHTRPSAVACSK
mmetsp:Transcript_126613/g.364183  ORF Transcript_126613/g.364183 Transcript_126613/m.364183 type:complete len:269 (-) Transcript_126613:574-1380(-)